MIVPTGISFNDYCSAIRSGNQSHVRVVFPIQNLILNDDDIAMDGGITITTDANPNEDLYYNTAVCSEIVINIINSNKLAGINWSEEFHVDFGIDVNDQTYWVTVGYFTGERPKRTVNTEIIEFVAYDRMKSLEFNVDDFIATLDFSGEEIIDAGDVFEDMCEYYNLPYVPFTATLETPNIRANPFKKGLTCRDILALISESIGCYAYINNEGEAAYKYIGYGGYGYWYTLYEDDIFTADIADDYTAAIDGAKYIDTTDPSKNATYPTGVTTGNFYYIVDNPILRNSSTVTTELSAIYNHLTSYGTGGSNGKYIPCRVTAKGNWLVTIGDLISGSFRNYTTGQTFSSQMPICRRTLVWNGGCVDTYDIPGNLFRKVPDESNIEKLSTSNIVNNLVTNDGGYVLDARQGKALSDMIENKLKIYTFSIPNNGTRTITIGGNATCAFLAMTASNYGSNRAMWMLNRQGSNSKTSGNEIMTAANITIGVGQTDNVITFAKSGTYSTYVILILYYLSSGTPPTITAS